MTLLCACGNEFESTDTHRYDQVVCDRCALYLKDPEFAGRAPCWRPSGRVTPMLVWDAS